MQNYDQAIQKAMQLAKTPEGQKLIGTLQKMDGINFEKAAEKAVAGDFSQAQQALSQLMENPEVRKLLENMGW